MKRLLTLLMLVLVAPLVLAQSSGINGIGGVSISGGVTAGHCAQFTAGGQISDAGLACGGSFTGVTTTGTPASGNIALFSGANTLTGTSNLLAIANGGTGTASPALVAGTNVTITGSWPNQTINSAGSMTWPTGGVGIPNYNGSSAWGTSYSATNTIPANFVSTLNQSTTGNAATATALAATPTQCTGSQFATGIAASGNANCATPSGSGTVTTTGSPASGQIAQFSGATSVTTATAANVLSLVNSQTCNAQTGTTYTLVLGDANNCVTMANAAANTITVPANATVAFPVGTTETVIQTGAGATTLQGAGSPVTLQSAKFGSSTSQTYAFAAEYSCISIQKTATDTWFVSSCDYNPASGGAGVTSFTGDGTLISNSGSTGAVTATLANAAANSLWGNTSGSTGAPGYHAVNSTALAVLLDTTAIVASVCTPSASSLAPTTGGTITQPGTPCTTVTFTFAISAPHGWNCTMGDQTQSNAGTFIPAWVQSSSSATTCVVKIPTAAQVASDVLSLQSSWY